MPWFWSNKTNDDDDYDSEEYDSDEYDSEEYSDDEDYYVSDNDDEEEQQGDDSVTEEVVVDEESAAKVIEEEKEEIASKQQGKEERNQEENVENGSVDEGNDNSTEEIHTTKEVIESEESDYESVVSSSSEEYSSSSSEGDDDDFDDDDDDDESQESQEKIIQVETVVDESSDDDDDDDDDQYHQDFKSLSSNDSDLEDTDDDEEVTSFFDKQALLMLAAEHDRVDILKAILADDSNDQQEKTALMSSGIPPLHVAISFGSTNTTQSLLRMGADPSIRPNVKEIEREYQDNKERKKLEIKNISRFDGASAWELAFGNAVYERFKDKGSNNSGKWSLFGNSSLSSDSLNDTSGDSMGESRIIRPLNMAPSKREGIRHAFTAEALRCIGGDEKKRLEQLLDSGMPPTIDIGGKDLYGWAVEMGAPDCEEILRPSEAAKYHNGEADTTAQIGKKNNDDGEEEEETSSSLEQRARVLDRSRPGEDETILQLQNKLNELESLATMLSTCLDNLAEEVSVCHGLLLMSGGASALASHVKSLKAQTDQKLHELYQAQTEWQSNENQLADLVRQTGEVGAEIAGMTDTKLRSDDTKNDEVKEDEESQRRQLKAQIAASENKNRKLRTSIADLSEESSRGLKEVERRGLSGGIDLVRNLRDELRDVDFKLSETKSLNATCRAKIGLIYSRINPHQKVAADTPFSSPTKDQKWEESTTTSSIEEDFESVTITPPSSTAPQNHTIERPGKVVKKPKGGKAASEKIATGDSQALAVKPPGNQGYFKVDLWQVLLRIIGMHRAADRRAIEVLAKQQKTKSSAHVMIV